MMYKGCVKDVSCIGKLNLSSYLIGYIYSLHIPKEPWVDI